MSQQPQGRRVLSPGIVSDPQINGGKAILEGTRDARSGEDYPCRPFSRNVGTRDL